MFTSLIVFAYLLQLCSFLSSCVYRRGVGSTLLSHHRRLSNVCTFYFVFSSLFWVWFIGAVVGVSKYRAFLHPITGLDDSFSFSTFFMGYSSCGCLCSHLLAFYLRVIILGLVRQSNTVTGLLRS